MCNAFGFGPILVISAERGSADESDVRHLVLSHEICPPVCERVLLHTVLFGGARDLAGYAETGAALAVTLPIRTPTHSPSEQSAPGGGVAS